MKEKLVNMEINSARSLELIVDRIKDLKHDIFTLLNFLRAKYSDETVVKNIFDRPGLKPPKKDGI